MVEQEHEPEQAADGRDETASEAPATQHGRTVSGYSALRPFADLQRQLAAFDFPAIRAAQRAVEQSAVFGLPEVWAAQDQVVKHFAQSIDFSHLAQTRNALTDALAAPLAEVQEDWADALAAPLAEVQKDWADSLAKAIHFPALESALASSAALSAFTESNSPLANAMQDQIDLFAQIAKSIEFNLPTFEVDQWVEKLYRWIPANLREVTDLEQVAKLALDEGLPLSWVPRAEIVRDLIEAESAEERTEILNERRDEVLDDCMAELSPLASEWAVQCVAAIEAVRSGLDGPAQSHASNIIDSIVLSLYGKKGRETAKSRAQDDFDDLPLRLAAENLTLRPLFRAFATWFPSSGTAPPEHFARHPTAHAVGHAGLFGPHSALVAVMLATSLTDQYGENEPDDDVE